MIAPTCSLTCPDAPEASWESVQESLPALASAAPVLFFNHPQLFSQEIESPQDLLGALPSISAEAATDTGSMALVVEPENEFVPEGIFDSPKHILAYNMAALEVLYGGIAGTGKSELLIARALKYVHIRGYNCLILRKTISTAERDSGIYGRLRKHLDPWIKLGIVRHNARTHSFTFPSGAVIEISYLATGFMDANQGLQYTTVIIDELTQIPRSSYTFWFSRMRRLQDQTNLPVQLFCACNPGGIGNRWVLKRWNLRRAEQTGTTEEGLPVYRWTGHHPDRVFLEAELSDNPKLDLKAYERSLSELDPVRRRQLKYGDWAAEDETRYKESDFCVRWVRDPTLGSGFKLLKLQDPLQPYNPEHIADGGTIPENFVERIFTTVDVAVSKRTGVGKTSFYVSSTREIEPSWSVAATWAACGPWLILLEVSRIQDESPQVVKMLKGVAQRWKRTSFFMEENGVGKAVIPFLREQGVPVTPIWTTSDKLTNSIGAQQLVSENRVVFPHRAAWLEDMLDEITSWIGHPDQTDDQVDTLSNAAKIYGVEPTLDLALGTASLTHIRNLGIQNPLRPGSPNANEQNPTLPESRIHAPGSNPFLSDSLDSDHHGSAAYGSPFADPYASPGSFLLGNGRPGIIRSID